MRFFCYNENNYMEHIKYPCNFAEIPDEYSNYKSSKPAEDFYYPNYYVR